MALDGSCFATCSPSIPNMKLMNSGEVVEIIPDDGESFSLITTNEACLGAFSVLAEGTTEVREGIISATVSIVDRPDGAVPTTESELELCRPLKQYLSE